MPTFSLSILLHYLGGCVNKEYLHREREREDYEELNSDSEELEPEESDHQQIEVEANIGDKIRVEVTARRAIIRDRNGY